MNTPPNPEEREFLDTLFETYFEMRHEKDSSIAHEAENRLSEKWNIKRDEKRKAPPGLLTIRRKCLSTGTCMVELLLRTNKKLEQLKK